MKARILKVKGVKDVRINTYSIEVEKGRAFSWEEVESGIKLILKECFKEKGFSIIRRDIRMPEWKDVFIDSDRDDKDSENDINSERTEDIR